MTKSSLIQIKKSIDQSMEVVYLVVEFKPCLMHVHQLLHLPFTAYLSKALIIMTGGFFGLLCFLLILLEFIVKLIVLPVIFSFTIAVLAYGFIIRKITQRRQQQTPALS